MMTEREYLKDVFRWLDIWGLDGRQIKITFKNGRITIKNQTLFNPVLIQMIRNQVRGSNAVHNGCFDKIFTLKWHWAIMKVKNGQITINSTLT